MEEDYKNVMSRLIVYGLHENMVIDRYPKTYLFDLKIFIWLVKER